LLGWILISCWNASFQGWSRRLNAKSLPTNSTPYRKWQALQYFIKLCFLNSFSPPLNSWTFTCIHCRSSKPSPLNNYHHCYQQHNLKLKYKHLFDVKIMDRQEHEIYFCCEKNFSCNHHCRHSFLVVIKEEDTPLQGVVGEQNAKGDFE